MRVRAERWRGQGGIGYEAFRDQDFEVGSRLDLDLRNAVMVIVALRRGSIVSSPARAENTSIHLDTYIRGNAFNRY
jgi:hypothetical protein